MTAIQKAHPHRQRYPILVFGLGLAALACTCGLLGGGPSLSSIEKNGCLDNEAEVYQPFEVFASACDYPAVIGYTPSGGHILIQRGLPTWRWTLVDLATGEGSDIPLAEFAAANPDLGVQLGDTQWYFLTDELALIREGRRTKNEGNDLVADVTAGTVTAAIEEQYISGVTFDEQTPALLELAGRAEHIFLVQAADVFVLQLPDGAWATAETVAVTVSAQALFDENDIAYEAVQSSGPINGGAVPAGAAAGALVSPDGQYWADIRGVGAVGTGERLFETKSSLYPAAWIGSEAVIFGQGGTRCPMSGGFGCPVDVVPLPILLYRLP